MDYNYIKEMVIGSVILAFTLGLLYVVFRLAINYPIKRDREASKLDKVFERYQK